MMNQHFFLTICTVFSNHVSFCIDLPQHNPQHVAVKHRSDFNLQRCCGQLSMTEEDSIVSAVGHGLSDKIHTRSFGV